MTTATRESLTPKQARVFDLLGEGKDVQQIAKVMRISAAGVYGHMRKIRSIGVQLPSEQSPSDARTTAPTPPPAATAATNGKLDNDPEASLRLAISQGEERGLLIEQEINRLEERIAELRTERDSLGSQHERYSAALAALVS